MFYPNPTRIFLISLRVIIYIITSEEREKRKLNVLDIYTAPSLLLLIFHCVPNKIERVVFFLFRIRSQE
jgi:hypothetical protein